MRRSFAAAIGVLAVASALVSVPAAGAATSLPTLTIALRGTTGVSVSGSVGSGAVNIVTTYTGKGQGTVGIVRLNPGVTIQQAVSAVVSHHTDINALDPYGSLIVSGTAPSTLQTVLTPSNNYVALNITGNGAPAVMPFAVTRSAAPAALPAASATETAIEFGFRGPKTLHDGTVVRAVNGGYLVHMDDLVGVRSAAVGRRVIALLRAGKDRKAFRLVSKQFIGLSGPVSPGGMQQAILHAKPGYYVEVCFMNTQDGREHTQLGMERLVRVLR